jgi:hypothetical protein
MNIELFPRENAAFVFSLPVLGQPYHSSTKAINTKHLFLGVRNFRLVE